MRLLRYVTAPAGSGCLTREAAAVPAGTQGTENISAAFGDRSSFVGHGSSAALSEEQPSGSSLRTRIRAP